MEWSLVRLAPAIVAASKDPRARSSLHEALARLDKALAKGGQPFLAGEEITSADIGVWSLLALEGTLSGAPEVSHVEAWFQRVAELPKVQDVLSEHPLSKLSLAAMQQSNHFGSLPQSKAESVTDSPATSAQAKTPDSPVAAAITSDEQQQVVYHFVYSKPIVEKEPRTV